MLPRTPIELKAQIRASEIADYRLTGSRSERKRLFLLGAGGLGKSTILDCIDRQCGKQVRARLDLAASRNRSALGVASSLVVRLDRADSKRIFELAAAARAHGGERMTRDALGLCRDLISSVTQPGDIFILDNLDRASAGVRAWLVGEVIAPTEGSIVGAGRTVPTDVQNFDSIPLSPLSESQMLLLSNFWERHLPQIDPPVISEVIRICSRGHPVRAELAAWAMSQVSNFTKNPNLDLLGLLDLAVQQMGESERLALKAAVVAYQRITPFIAESLEPGGNHEFTDKLLFAAPVADSVGGFILHPVASASIRQALPIGDRDVDEGRRRLANEIYPQVLSEGYGPEATSALELERLRYVASIPDRAEFGRIETAFRARLLRGEIWRADEIAQIAAEHQDDKRALHKAHATLIVAENAIARHDVVQAVKELDQIPVSTLRTAPLAFRGRIQLLRAKCVTSPAATSGNEIFLIADRLAPLLDEVVSEGDLFELSEDIRSELGNAYRLIARYEQALSCFVDLESAGTDAAAHVRALEDQAQLQRQMADLEGAERALAQAAILRVQAELQISGHGLYCMAALRRDQNDFKGAERIFERALQIAEQESDDLLACIIQGELSWMYFLAGDLLSFEDHLRDYEKIAELYGFSRELAECRHMRYHLAAEKDDWQTAFEYLASALELAKKFGNVIMQLDCMMHLVQRAAGADEFKEAELIISKMREIENRGCGARVFRGRARIYQGDGLLRTGRERDALLAWKEGFDLVANFGHSRSNVELLEGMMSDRRTQLLELLQKYRTVGEIWPESLTPLARSRLHELLGQ